MDNFDLSRLIYKIDALLLVLLLSSMARRCSADCGSMLQEQKRCFASRDLSIPVLDDQDVVRYLPAICRYQTLYSEALRCSHGIRNNCLSVNGPSPEALPDVERVMQRISFVCSRLQDVDNHCVQSSEPALRECMDRKTLLPGPLYIYAHFAALLPSEDKTCRTVRVWLECQEETYRSCPSGTTEVLAELTTKYFLPKTCLHQALKFEGSLKTRLPFETTALVSGLSRTRRAVICSDPASMQTAQLACYTNENISFQTLTVSSQQQSLTDSLLNSDANTKALCGANNLARQRAFACIANISKQCLGSNLQNYVQDPSKTNSMVVELCGRIDDIKYSCISQRMSAISDCARGKAQNLQNKNIEDLLCIVIQISAECVREAYPPCGCRTTSLFVKIFKDYVNPPACPAITEPTPVCVNGTDLFASGAVSLMFQTSSSGAAFFLATLVLMIFSF